MTLRILLAVTLTVSASPAQAYDRDTWARDYARLKVALAQSYANLDWQVERRGINLKRADDFITAMLAKAQDDTAATLAMVKLVEAFDDPHLELHAGPAPEGTAVVPRSSAIGGPTTATDVCAGYADGRAATRLPYASAPAWKEISAGPFQAGMIGDIGIIRIPSFVEQDYRSTCQSVARPGQDARALQLATRAALNRQLIALVSQLKNIGMKRLAIDISRNGGGSEWSSEAITIFAAGTLSRGEPRRAGPTCDRSAMWTGVKPACSPYAGGPTVETIAASPGENAWNGPLAILADHRTASAAEEFITWARDNGKAVMGGERTAGAGCGYMDGGAAFQFTAVPMHLMMPNCSRYTRDGINEIEGQAPDLAIDWASVAPDAVTPTLARLFAVRRP